MSEPPAILLVEDNEDDHFFTREMLREAFRERLNLEWVSDGEEARKTIRERVHDVYLVDHDLGSCTGIQPRQGSNRILPSWRVHSAHRPGQTRDRPRSYVESRDRLSGQGRDDRADARSRHPVRRRA